jgi:predicted dehydrogenase
MKTPASNETLYTEKEPVSGREKMAISRRKALKYLSAGAATLAASPLFFVPAAKGVQTRTAEKPVIAALVGGAHIHAPDFVNRMARHEKVETRYVWDPNSDTARARQRVSGGEIVDDVSSILSDPEVNALVVGTETFRHLDVISPAAASGKHLFVEKPVGMNGEEAEQIAEMVKSAGVLFQTGYFMRSSGVNRTIKKLMNEKALGDITRLRLSNVHSGAIGGWFDNEWRWMADPEQAGVGAFGDLGCHAADLLLWFMENDYAESCTAHINAVLERYPGCDEYGEGMVRFDSGAVATIAGGWVDHANPNQIEISGTKGHLRVTNGELFVRVPEMDASPSEPWQQLENDIRHPLDMFFDAISGIENLPLVTVTEAARVNSLISAMYRADSQRSWVSL